MRTTSRLATSAAALGGVLLFAAPASAHQVCPYPMTSCPDGGGGGTTVADGSGAGSGAGSDTLPFTGGELSLMALAGTAALGGGAVLVAAGRKRVSA